MALLFGAVVATLLIAASYQPTIATLFQFSILVSTASCLVPYLFCSATVLLARAATPTTLATRVVAALALAFSVFALIGTGAQALRWAGGLILAGLPVYAIVRMRVPALR